MPMVDVSFRLAGDKIPADHGYALLGAVSRVLSSVHGDSRVGIHPIRGRLIGGRMLALTERSRLTFRLDAERIAEFLPIAGKGLDLDGHTIRVGVPETRALVPAARLYSRLVVIKGFMEPDPFLEAVRRQLTSMDVTGEPHLIEQPEVADANRGRAGGSHSAHLRRTVRIRDKEIVGFAVGVEALTAAESIRVQERGVGGRRRFGCGVFVAERR